MVNNPSYFALLEACQQTGCPVCRIGLHEVERYLDNLFYENVNDWGLRRHMRGSLGFCREHAWQILEGGIGNGLGVAMIYHDVLKNVLEGLPETEAGKTGLKRISGLLGRLPRQFTERVKTLKEGLTPSLPCPACRQLKQTDSRTVGVLLEFMREDRLRLAFQKSQGLCLPHLRLALNKANVEADLEILMSQNGEKWKHLKKELAEYIRKNDYRFAREEFGSEGDSWRRAIAVFVGEKNILNSRSRP